MKKLSLTLCACVALSGCMFGFDPDIDSSSATRKIHHADYRAEFGCPLTDDHEAYRQCLVNTYYKTHPKTYNVTVDKDGKSVAVIKDETKSSYDKATDTYKTERVIVIETEEKLVPVPVQSMPMPTIQNVEPQPIENLVEEDCEEVEVETVKPVKEGPKPTTWWDTYQKNKVTDKKLSDKDGCPCADPNDPCPQCYDK